MKKTLALIMILTMTLLMGCGENTTVAISGNDISISTNDVSSNTEVSIVTPTPSPTPTPTPTPTPVPVVTAEPTVSDNDIATDLPTAIIPIDETMYITANTVSRETCSTKGTKVTTLTKGMAIHVIGQDKDTTWYYLEEGSFVDSQYVSKVAPTTTKTPATTSPAPTSTPTTSPSTQPTVVVPTPTPQPAQCQHTNTRTEQLNEWTSKENGCWRHQTDYQEVCNDCGVVVKNYTVAGDLEHTINKTLVIEIPCEHGSTDGYAHWHKSCDCGAINEDGPSFCYEHAAHDFVTFQVTIDGEPYERTVCNFCHYCVDVPIATGE